MLHTKILSLLDKGLSYKEISTTVGCSKSLISYYRARYLNNSLPLGPRPSYDWGKISAFYSSGHTYGECRTEFGFTAGAWDAAVKRGDIKVRPRRTLTLRVLIERGGGANTGVLKKLLLSDGILKPRCYVCGIRDWQEKPLGFILDHIDGINDHNEPSNLRILCPNCDSQSETYCGRNATLRKKLGVFGTGKRYELRKGKKLG